MSTFLDTSAIKPKYGLLIGCTYPNTPYALPGCDNDIFDIYKFISNKGYDNCNILCDSNIFIDAHKYELPTLNNIRDEFKKMIEWATENPTGEIFFHYSGHGSQVPDRDRVYDKIKGIWKSEEDDNKDECIISGDLKCMLDDEFRLLLSKLPETCNLFALMDACHSGSMFDLKYVIKGSAVKTTTDKESLKANIILLSGCKDNQTSASTTFGKNKKWYGAMTYGFLHIMEYMEKNKMHHVNLKTFMKNMNMVTARFPQQPQLSSSSENFNLQHLLCSKTCFNLSNTL
jgi:hypothetical protein